MNGRKFLLIKAYGWGFWADMEHLVGQLLVAELTGRIPVVHWGMNSLYSDTVGTNAFALYYEPVSAYTLEDVLRPEYTFYPPVWNYRNALVEDVDKTAAAYRNLGDMISSNADVVVSDTHSFARPIVAYVPKGHWAYGLTPLQIYRRIIRKYLKLKPDIMAELDDFYNEYLKDNTPVLGVHVRGTDKIIEVANLRALNRGYHTEIARFIHECGVKKIFLLTDSQKFLDEYKKRYRNRLISTDCKRSAADKAVQIEHFIDRRRKGIEIIKDTYLAARCDYFIGNGYSNVSFAVNRLKDWPDSHIVLFYNTLKQEKRLARRRKKLELLRSKNPQDRAPDRLPGIIWRCVIQMRFLLIKSWGYSFWADVEHVVGQLLIAEMTDRTPVVYWGMESMYSESLSANSFNLFFEPVSEYSVNDAIHPGFTYDPPVWNFNNVLLADPDKLKWKGRSLDDMMESNADVLVSDVYQDISAIIPRIPRGHALYGKSAHALCRYLYDKYLKVRPKVGKKVQKYINTHPEFRDEKPIVGVHVCGNALVNEGNQLYTNNDFYHPNIWQYFHKYNARHVFLITDSRRIVREYRKQYGFNGVLILSDSRKQGFRGPVRQCDTNYPNMRRKGPELIKDTMDILKDTYLALQCDFFIGNGYSSLSRAVQRLRDWPESNIKLLY